MYDPREVGPALQRLRERRRLKQSDIASSLGRSTQTISRIEQPDANPQASSLLRYLDAIGATLSDLEAELAGVGDPLDQAVAAIDQRIRDEPAYRRMARGMLERFGGPELPPGLQAVADSIDESDRIHQESASPPGLDAIDASPEPPADDADPRPPR